MRKRKAFFEKRLTGAILFAGLTTSAFAQGTGDATSKDVIAATVACVDAFTGKPDPLAYVPDSDWKIKRRTDRIGGERREFFGAEHLALNLRLQYEQGRSCSVYAFLPKQVRSSDGGDEASSIAVVNGLRSALSDTRRVSEVRMINDGYTVLVSDRFEIDLTYVGSGFDENLFYLITVRTPKPASAE